MPDKKRKKKRGCLGRFIFIIIVAVVSIGVWSAGYAGIGVDPECKEAMDSYEEFFDEYVEFMEKYENSGNPSSMLSNFNEYMSKYNETMTKLNAVDEDNLSDADQAYYQKVNERIQKKLMAASMS